MESQSTERINDVNGLQNQDQDDASRTSRGDVAESKRFKQELSIPKIGEANWAQSSGMLTRSKAQENVKLKNRELETDPLKMGHILEIIFSFLDANSIENARQVNKLWSIEGAKGLFTKCYVMIPQGVQILKSKRKNIKLNKFIAFLSLNSNQISKIPNIMVTCARDVEVWKSLGVQKMQVNALRLDIDDPEFDNSAKILHNILDLLPNVNHLSSESVAQFAIKEMIVLGNMMFYREQDGKFLVLSTLLLEPSVIEDFEAIEKFANSRNITIQELHFLPYLYDLHDMHRAEALALDMMSKLLSTSQNTVKKLIMSNCQIFLPRLNFQCMTALTFMDVNFELENVDAIFHHSFRFSQNVPNLEKFSINFTGQNQSSNILKRLFKDTGTAPSVKRLKYCDNMMELAINSLFQIFPNVEEFRVWGFSLGMFNSIWTHGANLKKLVIDVHSNTYTGTVDDLDSAFTGFVPRTVEIMKHIPNWTPGADCVERLRVKPSILNLKALEILMIKIRGKEDMNMELPDNMLAIAGNYAFRLMPNTRVIIQIRDFKPSHQWVVATFGEISNCPNVTIVQGKFKKVYSL